MIEFSDQCFFWLYGAVCGGGIGLGLGILIGLMMRSKIRKGK